MFYHLLRDDPLRKSGAEHCNSGMTSLNLTVRKLYESEAVGLFAKQYECLLTQFRSSDKSQKE